jgi:hypothetical protein
MTPALPAGLRVGLFALIPLLAVACWTPSVAPPPAAPVVEATPEPTPAPPPEPTPTPTLATDAVAGDVCAVTGVDRLTDGRMVVTDAGVSDAVTVYSAQGLVQGTTARVPLSFKSMEGPLPETIEDLAAVAARGDDLAIVGSFAHADGEGCPLPEHRAKILVGALQDGVLQWQNRLRVTPCAWNGTGDGCRGRPGGMTGSIEECKAALFTSKITRQGDTVCEVLVSAERAIAAGTCGPGMRVAAATIVPTRDGNKLWIALAAPLSVAGETILLRLEQPLSELSALSFDRASFLALPEGASITGLATDGDEVVGVADSGSGGILFRFGVRELDDGNAITPQVQGPELGPGPQAVAPGLQGPMVLFGGAAGPGRCETAPRVGTATP